MPELEVYCGRMNGQLDINMTTFLYMYRDTMTVIFLYQRYNFMYRVHKEWLGDLQYVSTESPIANRPSLQSLHHF